MLLCKNISLFSFFIYIILNYLVSVGNCHIIEIAARFEYNNLFPKSSMRKMSLEFEREKYIYIIFFFAMNSFYFLGPIYLLSSLHHFAKCKLWFNLNFSETELCSIVFICKNILKMNRFFKVKHVFCYANIVITDLLNSL